LSRSGQCDGAGGETKSSIAAGFTAYPWRLHVKVARADKANVSLRFPRAKLRRRKWHAKSIRGMIEHQQESTRADPACWDRTVSVERIFAPLDQILTGGGDTRLRLDPATMLNGYGCRPFSRPEAYTFASSTATSISDRGYHAASAAHQALMDAAAANRLHDAFNEDMERLRSAIMTLLDVCNTGHALVFSPSGTDSELRAVFVALATLARPVVSVIAGSDETGSGITLASVGRHFSSVTSYGTPVMKGEPIEGLAEHVTSVAVPLRTHDGALRTMREIDCDVIRSVSAAIASGRRVLLHAMDHSKLGWHCPSLDCVREISTRYASDVQVVIDACQMRISRARLRRYLDYGYMVQATGSKFFTGPPFSGALFVPARLAAHMAEAVEVPAGLRDYTSRGDWPAAWAGTKASLTNALNVGQYLRWVAAEEEMRCYFAVPLHYRKKALAQFAAMVPRMIARHASFELLPECVDETWDDGDNEELAVRTIFPFFLHRNGAVMSVAECTAVYRGLNRDLAPLLSPPVSRADRLLASQCCHIGQPVAVRRPSGVVAGALRISAGARILSETWSNEGDDRAFVKLAAEAGQVGTILNKIELILRQFDRLHEALLD
jgi:hypothetical protein